MSVGRRLWVRYVAFALVGFAGGWWASGLGPTPHDHVPEIARLHERVAVLTGLLREDSVRFGRWAVQDNLRGVQVAVLLARVDGARRDVAGWQARHRRLRDSLTAAGTPVESVTVVLGAATDSLAGACLLGLDACQQAHAADSLRIVERDSIIRADSARITDLAATAKDGLATAISADNARRAALRQRNLVAVTGVALLVLSLLR